MATQQTTQYVDFDEFIDFQLKKTRAQVRITDLLTALAGIATLVLTYLLVFTLLDHWVIDGGFQPQTRAIMLLVLALISGAWLIRSVVVPYMRRISALFAAHVLEDAEPGLKSSLLNLVDLRSSGRQVSTGIMRALEKRAAVTLSAMDVDDSVDRRPLLRWSYALLAAVVLCCLYSIFSPKRISFLRSLTTAEAAVATQTEIVEVRPGDEHVLFQSQIEFAVDLKGVQPEQVSVLYTTADRKFVDERLELHPVEEGVMEFRGVLPGENGQGILQDVSYYVEAGDARSRVYQLQVIEPPSAVVQEVGYEFPAYMEIAARTRPDAQIDAWEGTRVTVRARATGPVKSARILFFDGDGQRRHINELALEVQNGQDLEVSWDLKYEQGRYPSQYAIQCCDENDQRTREPARHRIHIRPDQPPEVFLDPAGEIERPANSVIPLALRAVDPDFQLRRVAIVVRRGDQRLLDQPFVDALTDGFRKQLPLTRFQLQLEKLSVRSGDLLSVCVEARDNKPELGQLSKSHDLQILITEPVDQQEVDEQLQREQQQQQERLDENQDSQNDFGEDAQPPSDNDQSPPGDSESAKPEDGDSGEGAGQSGSEGGSDQNTDGKSKDGKTGDGKTETGQDGDGQGKSGQGKSGQGDDNDPTNADNKPEDAAGDSENTDGKSGKADPGDGKAGEGDNADGKPNAGQPGEKQQGEKQQGETENASGDRQSNQNSSADGSQNKPTKPNADNSASAQQSGKQNEDGKVDPDEALRQLLEDQAQRDAADAGQPGASDQGQGQGQEQDSDGRDAKPGQAPQENESAGPKSEQATGNSQAKSKPGEQSSDESQNKNAADDQPQAGDSASAGDSKSGTQPKPGTDGKQPMPADDNDSRAQPRDSGQTPQDPTAKNGDSPTDADQGNKNGNPSPNSSPQAKQNKGDGESGQKSGQPTGDGQKPESTNAQDADNPGSKTPQQPNRDSQSTKGTSKSSPQSTDADSKKPSADSKNTANQKSESGEPNSDTPAGKRPDTGQTPPKDSDTSPAKSDTPAKNKDAASQNANQQNKSGNPTSPANQQDAQDGKPGSGQEKSQDNPSGSSQKSSQDGKPGSGKGESQNGKPGTGQGQKPNGKSDSGKGQGQSGKPGSGKGQGQSDQPGEAGNASQTESPDGKQPAKNGSAKKPAAGQDGAKANSPSAQDGKASSKGSPKSAKGSDGGGDQPGAKPGTGGSGSSPGSDASGPGNGSSSGSRQGPAQEGAQPDSGESQADDANLKYTRKAANLVLKRLQDQLKRGQVDQELLDRLGWEQRDLERFVDGLRSKLQQDQVEPGPESLARQRQFEETLRSFELQAPGSRQRDRNRNKAAQEGTAGRRLPIPLRYRERYDAFTRSLSRQKQGQKQGQKR